MSVLVISNAGTPRARRRAPDLARALPATVDVAHQLTDHPAEMAALVGHDRWRADDLLVINGGDGSVQHALSLLQAYCPSDAWPRIACLPGGSTNMTAYDLNRHRDFQRCLATLRSGVTGGALAVTPRPVVRVRDGDATRCGLFFGMGTIVQGIEFFQGHLKGRLAQRLPSRRPGDRRRDRGTQELGAGVALARTLWGIARHQPPFSEPLTVRLCAPELCSAAPAELSIRLLFATTLERLFLGIRPYWGSGAGVLRTTLIERHAPALIRRMPRLLRGRPDAGMTPAAGYRSARVEALALEFSGPYTLDGELFTCCGGKLDVRPTEAVRFVPL